MLSTFGFWLEQGRFAYVLDYQGLSQKITGLAPLLLLDLSTAFLFSKKDDYVRIFLKLLGHIGLGILHGPLGLSPLRSVPRHGTGHPIGDRFIALIQGHHGEVAPIEIGRTSSAKSPLAPLS